MIRQLSNFKFIPVFVFILSFALYLSNTGGVSIYILDEAKNAGCAREMFEKNDLIVPTFNDVLRTDKPPLHYYFMMLSYSFFGVNAFAARFFSAFFGACTILLTYCFTRKYADRELAVLTSIVLLASVHLSIQFHLAVPDPYLIFFLTAAFMSFYAALKDKKTIYILFIYISTGLGALSKGPVAIALPGLIFLLFLIFSKRMNWKEIRSLKPFWGALIVVLIALPWYILVHLKTQGAWTEGFFIKHNMERFTSEMEGHGGIFLITVLFIFLGMFPFSVFLIQSVKKAWKERQNDFILFNLIVSLTIITFFAFSQTKLPNYTVPAYPFLSILLAGYLHHALSGHLKLKTGLIVLVILGVIIVPGIYFALKLDPALTGVNYLAWYFLPLPAGLILAYRFWIKNKNGSAVISIAASGLATALIFFCLAFPVIDRQNPIAKSIHLLRGKEVRYYQKFNPAYSFSLRKHIPAIDQKDFKAFFREYPDGVIISTTKYTDKLALPQDLQINFSSRDIFESPTTVLITKRLR
jgi:4-amino-4-deoxy-L-arabinose transferase-like glycosyltransferase